MAAETPKLAAAEAVQAAGRRALDQQIAAAQADQTAAKRMPTPRPPALPEQATQADTLRAMLVTLDAQRRADAELHARKPCTPAVRSALPTPRPTREREAALTPFSGGTLAAAAQPDGQLTAPVAGTVFRSWGDPTDAGPATGISYHAAPSARVVSPCAGRVSFAESFRSYGLLMIVDCGGGYHAVLAGFERLDVKAGQDLRAGEPVGVMPGWNPGAGSRPSLYVELRHGEPAGKSGTVAEGQQLGTVDKPNTPELKKIVETQISQISRIKAQKSLSCRGGTAQLRQRQVTFGPLMQPEHIMRIIGDANL